MRFKPCIVIPYYNHGATIGDMVARLSSYNLAVFIVDDGSDIATATALQELAAHQPLVNLSRLPENRGKGAAVMHGMRAAYRGGFTHALQIDADGQHDCNDVEHFLAAGRARPGAVICGKPIYDQSVPRMRLYGRYLTHVWVWIETLSFAIDDSMCGFRLYPLSLVIPLIDDIRISRRMSFDIEILVRLLWRGAPVENLATRVIYPKDGISHFDLVRDNLRISLTHTRLVFGMLLRSPRLLGRRLFTRDSVAAASGNWATLMERGSTGGLNLVATAYRLLGRRITMVVLIPPLAYFYLTGGAARRASRTYLQRLAEYAGPEATTPSPSRSNVFRHFMAFAESALDKLAAWHGDIQRGHLDFPNQAVFEQISKSRQGALLVGAHLGNIEVTRALAIAGGVVRVNAVVYTEHAQRFADILAGTSNDFGVNLIQVKDFGADTAIALKEKIAQGELLVIVGDRTPPADNGRVVNADFLGYPAPFPQGPFILAHLLECPVYLFFCIREGDRYVVHLEPFSERVTLPRRERQSALARYAQRYAHRLETYCQRSPLQWFNFFDFWRDAAGLKDVAFARGSRANRNGERASASGSCKSSPE
ncbi:MAG: glycosyltransferase [Thiogranum sp.]|nr:glycosyltransferase [Thiogranum sp.]